MVKTTSLLAILFICCLCAGCKKKAATPYPDFFVAWWCGGYTVWVPNPHNTFISVTDSAALCDTMHPECYWPKNINELHFTVPITDAAQIAKLKNLPAAVPAEMYAHGSGEFGRPAVDAGNTFVWLSKNGIQYRWTFNAILDTCSPTVQQFYSQVQQAL